MMRNLKESIVDMYGLMLASVISFTINKWRGHGRNFNKNKRQYLFIIYADKLKILGYY
jgi:hypothetical protein